MNDCENRRDDGVGEGGGGGAGESPPAVAVHRHRRRHRGRGAASGWWGSLQHQWIKLVVRMVVVVGRLVGC